MILLKDSLRGWARLDELRFERGIVAIKKMHKGGHDHHSVNILTGGQLVELPGH